MGSSMEFIGYPNLKILHLKDASKLSMSLGFKPGSEFLPIFNHELQRARESGLLKHALSTMNSDMPKDSISILGAQEAVVLGFENLAFPFICLALGCLMASIFALFEKYG